VLVEELRAGRDGQDGVHLGAAFRKLNPRIIFGSVKGFSEGSPMRTSRFMKTWRSARAAPLDDRLLGRSSDGQRSGARRQQHRHASRDRHPDRIDRRGKTGKGQKVAVSMQDGGAEFVRVKLRTRNAWTMLAIWRNTRSIRTGSSPMRSPRRKRRRRRAAGLDTQVQGLGNRPERLHLLHDPGAELGADLPGDR